MKIENPVLLETYRKIGKCRYCGRRCDTCGHHVWSKGNGGPDIACNLIALGMPLTCKCHVSHHYGNEPTFDELLALSAADNDALQGDIEALVMLIRRMPAIRHVDEELYRKFVAMELGFGAQKLAIKELASFKHLLRST